MNENELARIVVDICFQLHVKYGPGLFESVYEEIICYELTKRDIPFERQLKFKVWHDGKDMGIGFKADIVVGNKLILELKSTENLSEVHFKQVITYLKVTGLKLGLLINFRTPLIKDGIHRLVNNL
ncbi:MAG: GxxExxY protein [Chitinophagaceae bacterium]